MSTNRELALSISVRSLGKNSTMLSLNFNLFFLSDRRSDIMSMSLLSARIIIVWL